MRRLIMIIALIAALVAAGLAMPADPPPVQALPPRDEPSLAAAKSWGYQLQRVDAVDVLVVDYSRDGTEGRALAPSDVAALQRRADGSRRVVLCYLSIGEAENYRFYWQPGWMRSPPTWLGAENPAWPGNFAVRYWDPGWQRLIVDTAPPVAPTFLDRLSQALFPRTKPYLDQIVEAGFDGVYLDRVDAYERAKPLRPSAEGDMITFVTALSRTAKARRLGFLVVPQNGEELLADPRYRAAIDAIAKEDLYYGENGDGVANKPTGIRQSIALLNRLRGDGRPVFTVEYLNDPATQREVADQWRQLGYIGVFAGRGLTHPPALPSGPAAAPAR
jgi:cysteinyl-tRNA synthetase, unknown class